MLEKRLEVTYISLDRVLGQIADENKMFLVLRNQL